MIMHDWDDERCVTILRNCRSAAVRPGGRALVVAMVIGEIGKPGFSTRVDVNMLALLTREQQTG
jgi:hypothetical protein